MSATALRSAWVLLAIMGATGLVLADPLIRDPAMERADRELVQAILREIEAVPTIDGFQIKQEELPAYSGRILQQYRPTQGTESPLREAVVRGTEALDRHKPTLQYEFRGDMLALKQAARQVQKNLATMKLEIDEAVEELQDRKDDRRVETSRFWQVKHDYVMARLLQHQAFLFEYQHALSEIRREELPPLKNNAGWKLIREKLLTSQGLEGRNARKLSAEADQLLERICKEHAGTPWATWARHRSPLGLKWDMLLK